MSALAKRVALALGALLAAVALLPRAAGAHGFGQRYDLPVPLYLYLYGASAAVILSFLVSAYFIGAGNVPRRYPRLDLLRLGPLRALATNRGVIAAIQGAAVVPFLLVIVSGFFGEQAPTFNFAPTFVWIIWWVGLGFFTALVGNIWPLINPWRTLFTWADGLARRMGSGGLEIGLPYPQRWGVWPALALYGGFVYVEIIFEGAPRPLNLALLAVLYSIVTWGGMAAFGRDAWLRGGEAFTVFFDILGRFAPTEIRVTDRELCRECEAGCAAGADGCVGCVECFARADPDDRQLNLRPWGVGLLQTESVTPSRLTFVVFMLASVTYDGLVVTPLWVRLLTWVAPLVRPLGPRGNFIVPTLGLFVVLGLFLALYFGFTALMRLAGGGTGSLRALAAGFVLSLVPIALAYQIAHYFSYLLIQGQLLIPLLSDPLGRGWNIFGTAEYRVNVGIVSAATAWYVQIAAIVLGHIVAVYLAHLLALRWFSTPRRALISQFPMLALMVLYTVTSLWILSQPVVEESKSGAPAGPTQTAVSDHRAATSQGGVALPGRGGEAIVITQEQR